MFWWAEPHEYIKHQHEQEEAPTRQNHSANSQEVS